MRWAPAVSVTAGTAWITIFRLSMLSYQPTFLIVRGFVEALRTAAAALRTKEPRPMAKPRLNLPEMATRGGGAD